MSVIVPLTHDEISLRAGGDVLSVPGLRGAAVATGVKPSGKPDLALIVADAPMHAAAVFTTCQAAAAPVVIGRQQLAEDPRAQVVVINSGNANALTGAPGLQHAADMVRAASRIGAPAWVLSTGVIGQPLPIDAVIAGIGTASASLTSDAGPRIADAMRTTDTTSKVAATRVGPWTVGGVAKGSGMIHPDMATMLAVIATDAPIEPGPLQQILRRAVDDSFHAITVDGDTSTNDTVLLLAGPGAPLPPTEAQGVIAAIHRVARSLALQIVEDGEGASRLLHIRVEGAADPEDARTIGRAIACSSLVKTALAGGDPNWGRIIAAAGNAGVRADLERWQLWIGDHAVFRAGTPTLASADALRAAFSGPSVHVRLRVGDGPGHSHVVTTDLTHEYVTINAEYTT